jgi:hypothetical protein
MSLDVWLTETRPTTVYESNITHNLGRMAEAAGIYKCLWRPEELGITRASELVELLEQGLATLKAQPEKFRQHDAPNGWGRYDHLVRFVEHYLEACRANPDAEVRTCR